MAAESQKINIEALAVYVRVDGETFLAPISPERASMFLGMISAFQSGSPEKTNLIRMPGSVAELVDAAGAELGKHIDSIKAKKVGAQ